MSESTSRASILVAEQRAEVAAKLVELLSAQDRSVIACTSGAQALSRLEREAAEIVICGPLLTDMSGAELVRELAERWPGLQVLMLGTDDDAPELRAGAADVLRWPLDADEVRFVVGKALTAAERKKDQPPPPSSSERASVFGNSAAMRQVYATVERAAKGSATVLVRGESGTGKELVSRAIHEASPRAAEAFVKIDCASLPEQLLESELFGYEKGAFTGAVGRKPGRAEIADKGTLFLDEIGELSPKLQAKLLRLLQDKQLERLGGVKTIRVDVRVVAATHRDLEGMIERGEFRQDLFYRLNVIPLWLPPLRARRDDIEALCHHFCETCARQNGRSGMSIEPAAVRLLRAQKWPGNVRQLQNFIERLVVLSADTSIREADVKRELTRHARFSTQPGTAQNTILSFAEEALGPAPATDDTASAVLPLEVQMRAAERGAIERALRLTKHNRSQAARLLGVSRSTLYEKLKEHGLL